MRTKRLKVNPKTDTLVWIDFDDGEAIGWTWYLIRKTSKEEFKSEFSGYEFGFVDVKELDKIDTKCESFHGFYDARGKRIADCYTKDNL